MKLPEDFCVSMPGRQRIRFYCQVRDSATRGQPTYNTSDRGASIFYASTDGDSIDNRKGPSTTRVHNTRARL
jgi:hypothetical protein